MKNFYSFQHFKPFLLGFSFLFTGNLFSQNVATVVDGNSEGNAYGPMTTFYNSSIHQNLYTSAQCGFHGEITDLEWEWDGGHDATPSIKVWLGTTSKTAFANTSDFLSTGEMTLVYTGIIDCSGGGGWKKITFDTPFTYDGSNSLVVAIEKNSPYSGLSSHKFKSLNVGATRTLWNYADGTVYDMTAPDFFGTSTYVPSLQLTYTVVPIVTVSGSVNTFSGCSGSAGTAQTVTISGSDLTGAVSASAPSGFEISLDNVSYSTSIADCGGTPPTLSPTTLYIRQTSSATGSPSGNVTITSTGAANATKSVSGNVLSLPTNLTASSSVGSLCVGETTNLSSASTPSVSTAESGEIGSAQYTNSLTVNDFPFSTLWHDARSEFLYTVSDLISAGLSADGSKIMSFSLNVVDGYTDPMNNFTVKMGHATAGLENFNAQMDFTAGLSTVYQSTESLSSTGWHKITLDSPFDWNGTQNLLIQICFDNDLFTNDSHIAYYATTGNQRSMSFDGDGVTGCTQSAEYGYEYAPHIKFEHQTSNYSWSANVGSFTSSDQNPSSVTPEGTTTYTLTVTDGNGCASTSDVAVTMNQFDDTEIAGSISANDSYVWAGNISTAWGTATNWYKYDGSNWTGTASAPSTTDRVFVIDDNGQSCLGANVPIASGTISDFTVKTGASVTLSGDLTVDAFVNEGVIDMSSRNLNIKGNFTNNGTLTQGTGTVSLTGSSAQTVAGSDLAFYNLTVNNSNGVSLSNDASVSNTLTMTAGKTSLGSSHLTLGTGASISGTPSSSNMIVAAGTGELRKEFTSTGTFEYPVGTVAGGDEYSPVTLTWNSATFAGTEHVGVRVSDSRSSFMNTGVDTYIDRNWFVEPSAGITSYDYNMELHYVQGDVVVGTYTEGDLVPIKYSSGTWYQADMIESVFNNTVKLGTGNVNSFSNVMNWDNLTSFSEFGGGGGSGQPLPVELTSFNGACDNGVISLAWETASENNSSHFDVEKSRDGENWTVLSTIAAAGTSNEVISYQAIDHSATDGNNYFRLRQVDIDGTEKLYDPINVSCEAISVGYFSSYPNPSGNAFQIVVNNEDLVGECVLNMVDAQGKVIERRAIEVKPGINMFVINQNLNPGMYFLNISNGSNSTPVIRHSIK